MSTTLSHILKIAHYHVLLISVWCNAPGFLCTYFILVARCCQRLVWCQQPISSVSQIWACWPCAPESQWQLPHMLWQCIVPHPVSAVVIVCAGLNGCRCRCCWCFGVTLVGVTPCSIGKPPSTAAPTTTAADAAEGGCCQCCCYCCRQPSSSSIHACAIVHSQCSPSPSPCQDSGLLWLQGRPAS